MSDFDFDALVVGAGAVGLGTGYALAKRGLSTVVVEKEKDIGQGVSSRNSEVLHGGLYYPTGSLKARLCIQGRRMAYAFMEAHNVPYDHCGKLVVAAEEAQLPALERVHKQSLANGVEGIRWLDGAEAVAMEPALRAVAAIHSPESGLMDSHAYMYALQGEIEAHGGAVAVDTPFEHAEPLRGGGFKVRTGGPDPAELTVGKLVTAAGLGAQAAAAAIEEFPKADIPKRFLGKGVYFAYHGKAPFSRLIYPPPVHGSLGVHYRRDLGGQARFGPDLEYVECEEYSVDPGRVEAFYAYIRKFWPEIPDGSLVPDYAGIRPKIHGPDQPQPDFRLDGPDVHGIPGLLAMFGIESPGLTSSMAIGEEVCRRLGLE